MKRKQEAWKLQVHKAKRQKVNQPNVQEEDDEKQQEVDEDDNKQENGLELEVAPVDNGELPIVIDNAEKEEEEAKDDLSDFEDILEPRKNVNDKEDQNGHFDDLEEFLEGFDDEELESFL